MRSLFDLLKGNMYFPVDIHDCYMGIKRYRIPWQSSESLTLESVERYCVLYVSEFETIRFHGISADEGGMLASRKIYERIRGLAETYIYWGATDMDFARRIGQRSPLVKLTHVGVFCYDLMPKPSLTAGRKENRDTVSESEARNGEDWGLGKLVLPKLPSLFLPEVDNTPKKSTDLYDISVFSDSVSLYKKPMVARALGSLMPLSAARPGSILFACIDLFLKMIRRCSFRSSLLLQKLIYYAVFNAALQEWGRGKSEVGENSYTKLRKARNAFLKAAIDWNIYWVQQTWEIDSIHAALAIAAVVGWRRPRRYFCCPGRDIYSCLAAAMIEPTLEITVYDNWQNGKNYSSFRTDHFSLRLDDIGFKGYCHFLTGAMETAFDRLREGQIIGEPYQVIFLNVDFMRGHLSGLSSKIEPLMDKECTFICKGNPQNQASFYKELQGLEVVWKRHDLIVYNLILR
jgi:hypothetical protein